MAVARFDEVLATKLSINPQLPMTGPEEPDRKSLLPLCVYSGHRIHHPPHGRAQRATAFRLNSRSASAAIHRADLDPCA